MDENANAVSVVFFCSRNKDNVGVEGFKQRYKQCFFTTDEDMDERFRKFVLDGVPGETCRYYISVNKRDVEKTKMDLMCYMIRHGDFNLTHLEKIATRLAMQRENAATKRWLFDFDSDDENALNEFVRQVGERVGSGNVSVHKTMHHYSVVCERGFDKRGLLEEWKERGIDVELKGDSELFVKAATRPKWGA